MPSIEDNQTLHDNFKSLFHFIITFIKCFKELSLFIICKNCWTTRRIFSTSDKNYFTFSEFSIQIYFYFPFVCKFQNSVDISRFILKMFFIFFETIFIYLKFAKVVFLKKFIILMFCYKKLLFKIKILFSSIWNQIIKSFLHFFYIHIADRIRIFINSIIYLNKFTKFLHFLIFWLLLRIILHAE